MTHDRKPELQIYEDDELYIDCFAGGGGTSTGIEWATGRSPDIAVNHDPMAVAMHAENHPTTKHLCGNIWDVRPREVCAGRRVGFVWFSPDCKHFSRAKGGKPVEKKIRSLAWVVVRWAREVQPRIIFLENVVEFTGWGPLLADGRPCPARRGLTFRRWVRAIEKAGYKVEFRELKACDFGAPTIRNRLFMVASREGTIVWPEPTHGKGRLPYRTAADCISWELPCRSIFGRKKPLAEKTLRRIARGVDRYVINAPKPFIVPVSHGGDLRVHGIDEGVRTITGAHRGELAFVQPFIAGVGGRQGHRPLRAVPDPYQTITAKNDSAVIMPLITKYHGGERGATRGQSVEVPIRTLDTSNRFGLVSATLVQSGYGERQGQAPRALDIEAPIGTAVAGGCKHALVTSFLAKHFTGATGSEMEAPMGAVTAIDHHSLVTSNLVLFHGSRADGQPILQPLPTVRAEGMHVAEVRAFLTRFNGSSTDGQPLQLSLGTVVTKDRFGLVVVEGEEYAIADIGLRMLSPRELFRAQGFPDSYIIAPTVNGKPLSNEAQVRMCGNSVSPLVAMALIRANLRVDAADQVA